MSFEIEWHKKFFIMRYFDAVGIEDITNAYNLLTGDPRIDDSRYGIVDLTELTELSYSDVDFKVHASFSRAAALVNRSLPLRVPAVAQTSLGKQMADKLNVFMDSIDHPWERKVFEDFDSAKKWASRGYADEDEEL